MLDQIARATALVLCLLLVASGMASAREPEFNFPQDVAGFARGARTDYEARAPGFGYSVVYTNGRLKADVYVYDGGVASIPDGPSSAPVAAQIAQATNEIRVMVERHLYRSSLDRGPVRLDGAAGDRLGCRAFQIDHPTLGPTESLLCVTGMRGKFVKFRISSPTERQAFRAEAERFMSGWLTQQ